MAFDTVDELVELKKLVDKATPKKPKNILRFPNMCGTVFSHGKCAKCNHDIHIEKNYCPNCGQAIDWGEDTKIL